MTRALTGPGPPRPRPGALLLLLLILGGVFQGSPPPGGAETLEGLAARLDDAVRQVDAARDGGAPLGDPGPLFPETEDVTWGDGTVLVDHASLRAEWRAVPPDGDRRHEALERLRQRLAAVRAEVRPAGSRVGAALPLPAEWREKLSEVLRRPEFDRRPVAEPLLARLIRWLRDKLGLQVREVEQAVGPVREWVIRILAGAALLMVLSILGRAALPLFLRDHLAKRPAGPPAPGDSETPENLLALAEARTRAGDFRGGVQALFRWMLLTLSETGRLDYDPALTNREHLARLKADGTVRAAFEDLARQFELVWYGRRPLGPEEYAAFRAGCQRLCREGA